MKNNGRGGAGGIVASVTRLLAQIPLDDAPKTVLLEFSDILGKQWRQPEHAQNIWVDSSSPSNPEGASSRDRLDSDDGYHFSMCNAEARLTSSSQASSCLKSRKLLLSAGSREMNTSLRSDAMSSPLFIAGS